MGLLIDLVENFQRLTALRCFLLLFLEIAPLALLIYRPFRSGMDRQTLRRLLAGTMIFLLVIWSIWLLAEQLYPEGSPASRRGTVGVSLLFRLGLLLWFSYLFLILPGRSARRFSLLGLLANYRIFISVIGNLYYADLGRNLPFYSYPGRLDVLLLYTLLLALSVPGMTFVMERVSKTLQRLPSELLPTRLMAIPISGALISNLMYLFVFSWQGPNHVGSLVILLYFAAMGLVFFSAYHYLDILAMNQEVQLQFETLVSGASWMQQQGLALRQFKHDLKSHLHVLAMYLQSEQVEEAKFYLQKLLNVSEMKLCGYYCDDFLVNIVLNSCMSEAGEGVSLSAFIQEVEYDPLSHMEVTVVLSNILHNAIEAVNQLPPDSPAEDRVIKLKVARQAGYMTLLCRNRCANEPQRCAEGYLSSKEDREEHGHGLEIIRKTIERHGGKVAFSCEDGYFTVSLLLEQ